MEEQAHMDLKQKQWTAAVGVCAEFRNAWYRGREQKDDDCFQPIVR